MKVTSRCNDCPWSMTALTTEEVDDAWLMHRERFCPHGVKGVNEYRCRCPLDVTTGRVGEPVADCPAHGSRR